MCELTAGITGNHLHPGYKENRLIQVLEYIKQNLTEGRGHNQTFAEGAKKLLVTRCENNNEAGLLSEGEGYGKKGPLRSF